MYTQLAPSPHPAPPDERAPRRLPPSDRFLRRRHGIQSAWQALCFWVRATSGVPQWLPVRWRRPLTGYLLALLVDGIAISLTFLLATLMPAFEQEGVLLLVGIVVVALICGVGPSLLATGIDLLMLAGVFLAPSLSGRQHATHWVDLVVLLVSGLGLSLLAGQSNWARRRAEALARSLRAAKARSDVERQRLRTLLEVLPVPIAMMDAQGRFLEVNPAGKTIWGNAASWASNLAEVPAFPAWRPDTGQLVARDELPLARALTTGEITLHEELEMETIDGQRKIIVNSAAPIRDSTGAIIGAAGVVQDITERKRLEREVAERAAQLEAIFESIADAVVVTDRQGQILHMNQAGRILLGMEQGQDPTGWTLPQLEGSVGFAGYATTGQRLAEVDDPVPRVLRGEVLTKQRSIEMIVRTRTGRETQTNSTGAPIRDATGKLLGAVLVSRDVTEQRRLEQRTRDALDALLAMAQALVQGNEQQAEQGMPALDLDQAHRPGADPSLARVAGVAARLAELTRRVMDCRSVSIVAIDPATEVLTPITVVGHSRADEERWWAEWTPEGEGDQPHLLLGNFLPPDAVKALQAGRLVQPERLPAPLRWWQRLCHMRRPALVPMHVGEDLVGLLQVDSGDWEDEEWSGTPEEVDICEQQAALMRAVARLGALVLERERLLRDRMQAQATELALRETQAQMEAFLATAAHDLRSPLTAAVGYLDLAARQTEQLAGAAREAHPEFAPQVDSVRARLDDAAEGTERLTRLLNLLFDTAALRAGKLELHHAPCDLVALVRAQVMALRVAAPARTIRLHVPADGEPILIEADADRLGQVVTNYVNNALKYSPPDRPVDVEILAREEGGWARVAVCDQGPGIPKKEQARVWERFHRVPGVEVQGAARGGAPGGSLGLGLHICKAIVEAHGGQVGVESTVGKGSTFWFTLPLEDVPLAQSIAS